MRSRIFDALQSVVHRTGTSPKSPIFLHDMTCGSSGWVGVMVSPLNAVEALGTRYGHGLRMMREAYSDRNK